jgi:hypothetical protein
MHLTDGISRSRDGRVWWHAGSSDSVRRACARAAVSVRAAGRPWLVNSTRDARGVCRKMFGEDRKVVIFNRGL